MTDSPTGSPAIVLFDGDCGLCRGAVRFIVERDPCARFRFAPLESEAGRRVLTEAGVAIPAEAHSDTMIVIVGGRVFERSEAVLEIGSRLPFPWPVLRIFRLVPRSLRDLAYRAIARNRHRWAGRRAACPLPTPEMRARLLE